MEFDAGHASPRAAAPHASAPRLLRVALLSSASAVAAVAFALFAPTAAHADDEAGLLGSLTGVVAAVEDPLADTLAATVDSTLGGVGNVVTSTVGAVAPVAAPVTTPVVTAVTQPVAGAVGAVADARPLASTTAAVVSVGNDLVHAVPVVGEVVDALPPVAVPPAAPEEAPASAATPESASPTESTTSVAAHVADASTRVASASPRWFTFASIATTFGDQPGIPTAAAPTADAPAQSLAPQHPSTPALGPGGAASTSTALSLHHAAEPFTSAVTPPAVALRALLGDEAAPPAPSFDSDCSPD